MKLASFLPFALVASSIVAPLAAHASPITFSAAAVSAVTVSPSSDTVTLNSTASTITSLGTVAFQTGNIYIGSSNIPDQIIPFSFLDAVTINGITQNITVSGQDNVTTGPDIITFFAGSPVQFGNVTFQLDASTYTGAGVVGENIPVTLSADLTQTPEPASLALLGTGLLGVAFLGYHRASA